MTSYLFNNLFVIQSNHIFLIVSSIAIMCN